MSGTDDSRLVQLDPNGIPAKRQGSSPVYVMAARWSVPHDDAVVKALQAYFEQNCSKWIFQAEQTVNDGKFNPHYQMYFNMKEKVRPKQLAISLNDKFRGIEIRACSNDGKEALKKYCMKSETRVAGPWSDSPIYTGSDLPSKLYPWQSKLKYFLVNEAPDDRTILWVADVKGCTGKSKFMKYMGFHHNALCLGYAQNKDIINCVFNNMGRKIYMFDLTRAKPSDYSSNDLYSSIESIKNGHIFNGKFTTGVAYMNPPHVVCFANFEPDFKKLSLDRWAVCRITSDLQLEIKK